MNIVSDSGWEWELVKWSDSKSDDDPSAYYRYAGCSAEATVPVPPGVWRNVFPDSAYYVRFPNRWYYQENLTYPSREYTYRYSTGVKPDPAGSYVYYYYRYNTGPATLMRMLVCSYQCCNGSLGCGSPVPCPLSDSGSVPMVKYSLYYA